MSESTRRRVTYSQLEMLWKFLRKNKEIATGYNKTSQARTYSRRMWEQVAHSLNSHGDGAEKDWKGWCKYWNDYKSKIKKLAGAQKASLKKTGGGPSYARPLTEIEQKFIDLMGPDFGSGLPGVRVEPFKEEFAQRQTEECGSELVQRALSHESQSLLLGMDTISIPTNIYEPGSSWRVDALTPHASPPMPSTPPLPSFHPTTTTSFHTNP